MNAFRWFCTAGLVLGVAACGRPEMISIPGVVGDTFAVASATLTEAGLTVVVDGGEPDDEEAGLWVVVGQAPGATVGEVEKGSEVVLDIETVIERAVDRCPVGIAASDGGRSVILDMEGEDWLSGELSYAQVECVLDELDVPDSVLARMLETRALDGRQDASWDGLTATWSYHPDDGLDVIVEFE